MSNHLLAGAAIGVVARKRPVVAFVAGLVSHLLLDACPHWGVPLDSTAAEQKFLRVARCDGCCGLGVIAVVAAAAGPARTAVLAGMAGGLLLDLDKPVKHFFGFDPFPLAIQNFHARIQRESPTRMPQEIAVGLVGAVGLWRLFRRFNRSA